MKILQLKPHIPKVETFFHPKIKFCKRQNRRETVCPRHAKNVKRRKECQWTEVSHQSAKFGDRARFYWKLCPKKEHPRTLALKGPRMIPMGSRSASVSRKPLM